MRKDEIDLAILEVEAVLPEWNTKYPKKEHIEVLLSYAKDKRAFEKYLSCFSGISARLIQRVTGRRVNIP